MLILLFIVAIVQAHQYHPVFELYNDIGMRHKITVHGTHLYMMSSDTANMNDVKKALFRQEGAQLYIDDVPICGREYKYGLKEMEICTFGEGDDSWRIKFLTDQNIVKIQETTGKKCMGFKVPHRTTGPEDDNQLLSVYCSDPRYRTTFYLHNVVDHHDTLHNKMGHGHHDRTRGRSVYANGKRIKPRGIRYGRRAVYFKNPDSPQARLRIY